MTCCLDSSYCIGRIHGQLESVLYVTQFPRLRSESVHDYSGLGAESDPRRLMRTFCCKWTLDTIATSSAWPRGRVGQIHQVRVLSNSAYLYQKWFWDMSISRRRLAIRQNHGRVMFSSVSSSHGLRDSLCSRYFPTMIT